MSEKLQVTLTDGRVVEFGARAKLLTTVKVGKKSAAVTIDCRNGETFTVEVPLNAEMLASCVEFAIKSKAGDGASGKEANEASAWAENFLNGIAKGIFPVRGAGRGETIALTDQINGVHAYVTERLEGKRDQTLDETSEWFNSQDEASRKEILALPDVKVCVRKAVTSRMEARLAAQPNAEADEKTARLFA